jgi:hypothetical protein
MGGNADVNSLATDVAHDANTYNYIAKDNSGYTFTTSSPASSFIRA